MVLHDQVPALRRGDPNPEVERLGVPNRPTRGASRIGTANDAAEVVLCDGCSLARGKLLVVSGVDAEQGDELAVAAEEQANLDGDILLVYISLATFHSHEVGRHYH